MGGGIVLVQLNGAPKFRVRFAPPQQIRQRESSGRVRFRKSVIQFNRFAAGFVGQYFALLRGDADAVAGSDVVGIGESGIGEGVVGIGGDRLLEQIDTLLQAVGRASVPELPTLQI